MNKMKPKCVYFDILNYTSENLSLIENYFDCIHLYSPKELNKNILSQINLLFAPLGYHYDATIFNLSPNLEAICTNTTGVPHIDVVEAKKRGIKIFSLKNEIDFLNSITPTAEWTMALIFAITRNMLPAIRSVQEGKWSRWEFAGPWMLSRATIGIVGLGRLGSLVANYCKTIGSRILYYDPYVTADKKLGYIKVDDLCTLAASCDIMTIHVHADDTTYHLINEHVLSCCQDGTYLINTARGEVVDSNALIKALETKKLAGAALDVLEGEFDPDFDLESNPLIKYSRSHDNLIITPHIGGSTRDAWHLTQRYVIQLAIDYFENKKNR
jgi:D-3-phosphoglycerate dehydrogenase